MNVPTYTGYIPQTLKICVRTTTGKPEKIRIVVCDANQNNTVFTNRYNVFNGDRTFYVRLPLAPKVALVQVYNEAIGNRPIKDESTFIMIDEDGVPDKKHFGIYAQPLEKKMDVVDIGNPEVKSFISFAQRFCYNLGIMETGTYKSGDGRFTINFMPIIEREMKGGKKIESSTPARIGEETKEIDVSQKIMLPFTVPMRFAILCHEFAHCYLNYKPESEVEADLQGLLIYLGLGYPRIEAHQAFTQTFMAASGGPAGDLNAKRYRIIEKFINDFENHKMLIYE